MLSSPNSENLRKSTTRTRAIGRLWEILISVLTITEEQCREYSEPHLLLRICILRSGKIHLDAKGTGWGSIKKTKL